LHELPESIISDRGVQFVAGMMKKLNHLLGIQTKLLTAYHSQTYGQTERINQELEQYLRVFIDHRQEQWCQGRNSGRWKDRIIDRNYNPEQSKVLCWRGVLLSDSIKKAPMDS